MHLLEGRHQGPGNVASCPLSLSLLYRILVSVDKTECDSPNTWYTVYNITNNLPITDVNITHLCYTSLLIIEDPSQIATF
jgi:hypothetical protein